MAGEESPSTGKYAAVPPDVVMPANLTTDTAVMLEPTSTATARKTAAGNVTGQANEVLAGAFEIEPSPHHWMIRPPIQVGNVM
ncbi:hypothetical protein FQZ97_1227720 [compost metagenome]